MQAVIVSFDSLAATSLGCYGNEWVETPHWDRLAATGAVFDNHFVDTVGPHAGLAWANGQHTLSPNRTHQKTSLGSLLKSHGVASRLIAAGSIQDWQQGFQFDDIQRVSGRDGFEAKPDQTPFAEVVKSAIAAPTAESTASTHTLLWLHGPGPGVPPEGFDALYFEDFDERGQQTAELTDEQRARHPAVYAGSVSLIDYWLGELLQHLQSQIADEPLLVIVIAARGDYWQQINPSRLNESLVSSQKLGDQVARTPLVLRVQGDLRFDEIVCLRSSRLVQTYDLVPTLLDWFHVPVNTAETDFDGQSLLRELTEEAPARTHLWYGDEGSFTAVRTQDWLCIRNQGIERVNDPATENEPSEISLFVKPEDSWDINDIASQQPEVIADLLSRLPLLER